MTRLAVFSLHGNRIIRHHSGNSIAVYLEMGEAAGFVFSDCQFIGCIGVSGYSGSIYLVDAEPFGFGGWW